MKVGLRLRECKYAQNCSLTPNSFYFLSCHHKMLELEKAVRYHSLQHPHITE